VSDVGLEAVVGIEFPDDLGRQTLAEHKGTTMDYHCCLYPRRC